MNLGKIITFSFKGAGLLIGSAIGGAVIAAIVANGMEIELPNFPATVIGVYESVRERIFFWRPAWWPHLLSDVISLYTAIAFSFWRGFEALYLFIGYKIDFWDRIFGALFWPARIISLRQDLGHKKSVNAFKKRINDGHTLNGADRTFFNHFSARYRGAKLIISVVLLTIFFSMVLLFWESLENAFI